MTTTELLSGRITSFQREQAFGLITLDDGTQVKFDAGICTMVPEEGAAVRLRVGPAKWGGGLKALFVEPAGNAIMPAAPPPPSLEDQLAAVQREHLVAGLSENVVSEIVAQRFGGAPAAGTILELLDTYWSGDPVRARSDGYLRRGAGGLPEVGDDVLAELAELLPGAKLPRQVRWEGRGAGAGADAEAAPREQSEGSTVPYGKLDASELLGALDTDGALSALDGLDAAKALGALNALDAVGASGADEAAAGLPAEAAADDPVAAAATSGAGPATLVVADPDGRERSLTIASLDDVIELANAALRRGGDGRRVYKLKSGTGWQAYLALASDRAHRLARALPFATPPADVA